MTTWAVQLLTMITSLWILLHGGHAHSCGCAPLVPQQAYCHSILVVRCEVSQPEYVLEQINGEVFPISDLQAQFIIDQRVHLEGNLARRYQIYPQQVFKGEDILSADAADEGLFVYAHHESIYCGLLLDSSTEYILSAYMSGSMLWTDACQMTFPWQYLPVYHQLQLQADVYDEACHCQIVDCSSQDCSNQDNQCHLDRSSITDLCYMLTSYCAPSGEDLCSWKQNNQLERCLHHDSSEAIPFK